MANEFIEQTESVSIRVNQADAHFLKGRILLDLGKRSEGKAELLISREIAEQLNNRRVLWMILRALAKLEGPEAAQDLLAEADEIIAYIADHTGSDAYSAAFLKRTTVTSP